MPATARHLVCTAVRPPEAADLAAAWRTETAVALARGIVADEAVDRMPILADALEDAGCDDPVTLRHCRECQNHTTACWLLGDLLDRPLVLEPERMTDREVEREVERVTGRRVGRPSAADSHRRVILWRLVPFLGFVAVMLSVGWSNFGYHRYQPGKTFETIHTSTLSSRR